MVTTDPIADMLTRIRNANDAYHATVDMPASKMKAAVLTILKDEGFVKNVEQVEVENHPTLRVCLKYGANREKGYQRPEENFQTWSESICKQGRTAEGSRRSRNRNHFHIQGRHDRQSSS